MLQVEAEWMQEAEPSASEYSTISLTFDLVCPIQWKRFSSSTGRVPVHHRTLSNPSGGSLAVPFAKALTGC